MTLDNRLVRAVRSLRLRLLLTTAPLALVLAMADAPAALAQTVTLGGDNNAASPTDIIAGYQLRIGTSILGGSMTIDGGAHVENGDSLIGNDGVGTVEVTGANSHWDQTGRLDVGNTSHGSLEIAAGARVSDAGAVIGNSAAGDVVVNGSGSTWNNTNSLAIGNAADGTLSIESGATVTSGQVYIGGFAGATGGVVATGTGSNWQADNITVGNLGNGSIIIEDGASVVANAGVDLGSFAGSRGTVDLLGTAGSRGLLETTAIGGGDGTAIFTFDGGILRALDDNDTFFSGYDGKVITINGGGAFVDTNGHDIGISPVMTGLGGLTKEGAGTLTLIGVNNYAGHTTVSDGELRLENGGQITATDQTYIANATGAQATVTGTGSSWTTQYLSQDGAALTIEAGGTFHTLGESFINSGDVLVTGSGSSFITMGDLTFGRNTGATSVTVAAGAHLSSDRSYIGEGDSNATSLTATVTGAGSLWDAGGLFTVGGNTTTTAELTISDGGKMTVNSDQGGGIIGFDGLGTALVTGARSELSLTGGASLFIGYLSGDGTLTIEQSGLVTANTVWVGNDSGSTGTLLVNGTPGAEGLLSTVSLREDQGDASVKFDGGILRAMGNSSRFIHGFEAGDFLIEAGGMTIDSQSFTVTASSPLGGTGALTKIGAGKLILSGDSTLFGGATTVAAGTLAVNGSLGGTMDVLSGARLQGSGFVGDTTIQAGGIIAPGNSINTLTVANYVGNGGTLEIEAVLGDDTSASDLLAVTGATSGTTDVKVVNLGGGGAQTTEGIKIVDVGGASGGTFSLLGDFVFEGEQAVVGGAYGYRLYQGGASTPLDGDWYLRSTLLPTAGSGQLFQPGAPIYEAYANILQSFNGPDTLQQRVGNRSWLGAVDNGGVREAAGSGIWGRIVAGHASLDATASTTGANSESNTWQLQAGTDNPLYLGADGRLIAGLSARYGTISADIASPFGDGSIGSTGYGLSGSLTWYGNAGFYLDGQANLTWYDSSLSSSLAGRSLVSGNTGFGYGLGVEAGQQIALGPNWSITPQAQLSYSAVDYDDFTDTFGAAVSMLDSDRLKIRLGLSADYQTDWTDTFGQTSRLHAYGIANLYYDLIGGSKTNLAGVILTGNTDQLWGGVGAGGSYSWEDEAYTLHGEVALNTGLNHFGGSYNVTGTVGFRGRF